MTHMGDLISAYLDGETSPAESRRVVAHMESCHRCRGELAETQAARAAVRALPMLEIPDRVFDELGLATNVTPMRRRPLAWVAAAAAAVIVFVTAATLTAPDAIGVTLSDISNYHEQQQLIDPGIAPAHLGVLSGGAQ